jgi:hypothetical protein
MESPLLFFFIFLCSLSLGLAAIIFVIIVPAIFVNFWVIEKVDSKGTTYFVIHWGFFRRISIPFDVIKYRCEEEALTVVSDYQNRIINLFFFIGRKKRFTR